MISKSRQAKRLLRSKRHKMRLGGRMKLADELWLVELWENKTKLADLRVHYETIKKFKGQDEDGQPIFEEEKKVSHFDSGRDAFAYHVLKGDKDMIKNLTSKLFADKKFVEGGGEDGTIKIEVVRFKEEKS